MGTRRVFPNSIKGRQTAMTVAVAKKNGAVVPPGNILSAITSARLDTDSANYDTGISAVTIAKESYHNFIELAKPERIILKSYVFGYQRTIISCIEVAKMPASVRAFYGLPITNRTMPKVDTDVRLLAAAGTVVSGDAARVLAGGIAMSMPTILEFVGVYSPAKLAITSISNAKTGINTAIVSLVNQIPEVKDLIKHVWDEVELFYSLLAPPARRAECRLWGLRYISTGMLSVITGNCQTALGVAVPGVKIRLVGSSHSVLTDALGNFSLNTSLYGDLELIASLKNFETNSTDFSKADGVASVVNVVMVADL